ncbi:hypothetical protein C8Q75DRAFT_806034 [Abortiporus biennis]|nr:hypothetical protein C8Q75DRAFT_806034 [Abortiporus biennis]
MPHDDAGTSSSKKSDREWRATKMMNMSDLSRDDDFLSHLLVEKLGTGDVPLVVHKMDPMRTLPKTDTEELMDIVRRLIAYKGSSPNLAVEQAVTELLLMPPVRYFLDGFSKKQVNAFATHASRYFELYLPSGSIEIAHTSRYSHRTGKSELCILATRPLAPGTIITELKGSMADLTEDEDKELKRTDERHVDGAQIRRDFSVIHSKQLKKNHLFLGPARFVNHDCDHNVELFRTGRYITFRVIKPIAVGEEVTAHYGDGYFGKKNRHCLCHTCEKLGRGGYAPESAHDDDISDSDAEADGGEDAVSDSSSSNGTEGELDQPIEVGNVNERRTRRGVYAVVTRDDDDEDTESHAGPADNTSELTSLPPVSTSSSSSQPRATGLLTPDPEDLPTRGRSVGRQPSVAASIASTSTRRTSNTYKSIITTRAQQAREASAEASVSTSRSRGKLPMQAPRSVSGARQLVTPPLTVDNSATSTSNSVRSSSRLQSRGTTSALVDKDTASSRLSTPVKDKGKGRATASVSDARESECRDLETRSLRPRASVTSLAESDSISKKLEDRPRGLDGKPLPTCVTCGNILPVISVDHQVVWGLSVGRTGKRGRPRKNMEIDCPRCMRHFAIYNVKWPDRIPNDGTLAFVPPPRIVRKYSTPLGRAESEPPEPGPSKSSSRKRQREASVKDPRPSKKRREQPQSSRSRGRPTKNKVGMSDRAKEILSPKNQKNDERRSGRTRVPTLKLRESLPPPPVPKRVSPRKNRPTTPVPTAPPSDSSLTSPPASDDHPQFESPERPQPSTPKAGSNKAQQLTPKSRAVAAQPRDANGRFGKKHSTNGRYVRKSITYRKKASQNKALMKSRNFVVSVKEEQVDDELNLSSGRNEAEDNMTDLPSSDPPEDSNEDSQRVLGKRSNHEDAQEQSGKRLHTEAHDREQDNEEEERRTDESADEDEHEDDELPSPRPLVRVGMALFNRPNPSAFARRKWVPADAEEQTPLSTDEDSDPPVTPEDDADLPVTTGHTSDRDEDEQEDEGEGSLPKPSSAATRLGDPYCAHMNVIRNAVAYAKLFKPSPMNMARRRWGTVPESKAKTPEAPVAPVDEDIAARDANVTASHTDDDDDDDPWYDSDEEDGRPEAEPIASQGRATPSEERPKDTIQPVASTSLSDLSRHTEKDCEMLCCGPQLTDSSDDDFYSSDDDFTSGDYLEWYALLRGAGGRSKTANPSQSSSFPTRTNSPPPTVASLLAATMRTQPSSGLGASSDLGLTSQPRMGMDVNAETPSSSQSSSLPTQVPVRTNSPPPTIAGLLAAVQASPTSLTWKQTVGISDD